MIMSEHSEMSDVELVRSLHDLGQSLEEPMQADLARVVRGRSVGARRPHWARRPRRVAAAVAGAALVIVVSVPGLRTAVAHTLGIGGVNVRTRTPTETVPPVASQFYLGDRVTLQQARESVPFTVRVPGDAALGSPTEVYLRVGGVVSFVYPASPTLPPARETQIGMILTQFSGNPSQAIDKLLNSGTEVERLEIGGEEALWITGEEHFVFFVDPQGRFVDVPGHIAGNALVWLHDGVTLRLEANVTKAEALRIARSIN